MTFKSWKTQQRPSENPNESNEDFPVKSIEKFKNLEKIKENPKKALESFATEKLDKAKTGFMAKASEKMSQYTPEWMKKIGRFLEKKFSFLREVKDWFSEKIENIGTWITGTIGGFLWFDFLKDAVKKWVENVSNYVEAGIEMFLSIFDNLPEPAQKYTNKVREFVHSIDFNNIKRVFTSPKEVAEEIQKRVCEKFPEIGYYFAINNVEEEKDETKKIDLQQVALFDFAIGHFKNKSPTLSSKLKELKNKVKKKGYASLTEDDWENLSDEFEEIWYKPINERNGLLYFEEEWGNDKFKLWFSPEQTPEELSEIKLSKLAISNAYYENTIYGIDVVQEEILKPLKDNLSKELKEHLENHDFTSLAWYKNLWDILDTDEIPHIVTWTWMAFYKGWKWYVIESLGTMKDLVADSFAIAFTGKTWEKDGGKVLNEFGKNIIPITIVWGAYWGMKGLVKIPYRMLETIWGKGIWPIKSIPLDVFGGVAKGATAPFTVSWEAMKWTWKGAKALNNITVTAEEIKQSFKNIKPTTVVKAQELGYKLKTPVRALQRLTGLRTKEELLYQELLENQKVYDFYNNNQETFFGKNNLEKSQMVEKEIHKTKDIIEKRTKSTFDKLLFKWKNKKLAETITKKTKELIGNQKIKKEFFEYLKKSQLISPEDAQKFHIPKSLEALKIEETWYNKRALETLRAEGKLWNINKIVNKLNRLIESKATALRKSSLDYLKTWLSKGKEALKATWRFASQTAKKMRPLSPLANETGLVWTNITPEIAAQQAKKQWVELAKDKVDEALRLGTSIEQQTKPPTAEQIQKAAIAAGETPASSAQIAKNEKLINRMWEKLKTKLEDPKITTEIKKWGIWITLALFLNGLSKAENPTNYLNEFAKNTTTGIIWFKVWAWIWRSTASLSVAPRLVATITGTAATFVGWWYVWDQLVTKPTTKYLPNIDKYTNQIDASSLAMYGSFINPYSAGIWWLSRIWDLGKVIRHTVAWGRDVDEGSDPFEYLGQTATGIELSKFYKEWANEYHFTNVYDWNKEIDETIAEYEEEIKDEPEDKKEYEEKIKKLKKMYITPEWFQKKDTEFIAQSTAYDIWLDSFIDKTSNRQKTQIFLENFKDRLKKSNQGEEIEFVKNEDEEKVWKELCDLKIENPQGWTIDFYHLIALIKVLYSQQNKLEQLKRNWQLRNKN